MLWGWTTRRENSSWPGRTCAFRTAPTGREWCTPSRRRSPRTSARRTRSRPWCWRPTHCLTRHQPPACSAASACRPHLTWPSHTAATRPTAARCRARRAAPPSASAHGVRRRSRLSGTGRLSAANDGVVSLGCQPGGLLPGVSTGTFATADHVLLTHGRVLHESDDRLGESKVIMRIEVQCAVPTGLAESRRLGGDHRASGSEPLKNRQTESFVKRRDDGAKGSRVHGRQLGVRQLDTLDPVGDIPLFEESEFF